MKMEIEFGDVVEFLEGSKVYESLIKEGIRAEVKFIPKAPQSIPGDVEVDQPAFKRKCVGDYGSHGVYRIGEDLWQVARGNEPCGNFGGFSEAWRHCERLEDALGKNATPEHAIPPSHYLIPIEGIPDGYEPVRYGIPDTGELFFFCGRIVAARSETEPGCLRLIVKKTWKPPANAKPGLTFYPDGKKWLVTQGIVRPYENKWSSSCYSLVADGVFSDFVPPADGKPFTIPEAPKEPS